MVSPAPSVDFGYRQRTIAAPGIAFRVSLRGAVVGAVLIGVALALGCVALGLGEYPLSPGEVVDALLGRGETFPQTIVREWRLPVAAAALLFGALLGVGGALFQSLTRNPLGSPDVIGFDAGSYFGVVVVTLVVGTHSYWATAGAALAGGLLTGILVYALAYRRGVQGVRLIIVGIAVSAMLVAINAYLVTRADIDDAMSVGFWAAGSLTRVDGATFVPSLAVGAVLLAGVALGTPGLRQLELGDDAATAHGVNPTRIRPALLVAGAATTAVVTAAAGPISFIALAAPQLARRLTGSPGVTVPASALMGAALLAAAHALSQGIAQVFRPVPVGLLTILLGGLYLIWLLIHETRRHA
ncbi:FecCD family ABC transporter permease [Microbacterium sp. XT11]|uniref:FecCD family ABC transporter permease n=1 Tax=Microbacterium sp. XT11 TaxID=367477 RepID=UPI000742EBA1|nr:iron chelate uptake ABC transporter family permease subunit [Microbacterium sp. XT11]ALX67198.1 iron-siderophore ABC transporter,inner membrane subunit [Microbacterium sp. XT11]